MDHDDEIDPVLRKLLRHWSSPTPNRLVEMRLRETFRRSRARKRARVQVVLALAACLALAAAARLYIAKVQGPLRTPPSWVVTSISLNGFEPVRRPKLLRVVVNEGRTP
jgi:hypothetical protein